MLWIVDMLVCSAVLPPPVHGQSMVNAWVRDVLIRVGIPHIWVDTSPGSGGAGWVGYHARRIVKVLVSAGNLFRFCFRSNRVFYTVFESGYGVAYNLFLMFIARVLGFRIILHHHTSAHMVSRSSRFEFLIRVSGGRCEHIVLTDGMCADMLRLYGVRAVTLSNWIVVKECLGGQTEIAFKGKHVGRRVGYIANISESKGFIDFCEVVREGLDADPYLEIWIAGPVGDAVSANALNGLIERSTDRIKYWGAVSGQRKEDFFSGLDLLLFPTRYRYEAAPLVVLEALLRDVAVFSLDRGYVKDILPKAWVFGDIASLRAEFNFWIRSADGVNCSIAAVYLATLQDWRRFLDEYSSKQFREFISIIGPS
jgi:glycosyltransferase involved in cell wall biosynthesis